MCPDCKSFIVKNATGPVEWYEKKVACNLVCEYCFEEALYINIKGETYNISCKDCSSYSDKAIPVQWLGLIETEGTQVYDERISLLEEKFSPAKDSILQSIDNLIFKMTTIYRQITDEIDKTEQKNISTLDSFSKELQDKTNELRNKIMTQGWEEEIQIYTINLESYISEIITSELMDPEEFKKLLESKLQITVNEQNDCSRLLLD